MTDAVLKDIAVAQRERAKTVKEMANSSLFFFRAPLEYDDKAVRKHINAEILQVLDELVSRLEALGDWSAPSLHELLSGLAAVKGISLGKLAQPLRLAICGGTVSPPIDATLSIVGRTETLARIAAALHDWRR